jgi:hypothetical protein
MLEVCQEGHRDAEEDDEGDACAKMDDGDACGT